MTGQTKYICGDMAMEKKIDFPPKPRVVEAEVTWEIGDELANAVITAAVYSVEKKPGTWQKMINALHRGAEKTEEGTVNAFLFRAMVDHLLEEYRALDT